MQQQSVEKFSRTPSTATASSRSFDQQDHNPGETTAENIVYGAFAIVEEKTGGDPLSVFKKAMDNVRPTLEVKPKRVGGATYQVPMEVNSRRATTLAIRWIVDFSRKRKEHTMKERLAAEIMDAAENTGASVKKREDLYKMAESNRAFSHYRF